MATYKIVTNDGVWVQNAGVFTDHNDAVEYARALGIVQSRQNELVRGEAKNSINYWIETKE